MTRKSGALLVACATLLGAALAGAAPDDKPAAKPQPSPSSGLSPMPGGSVTPKKLLPPGADWPDKGPSSAIYPSQRIPIRFNHQVHVGGISKLACTRCHQNADKSTSASDDLLPKKHDACIGCHAIDEKQPEKKDDPPARCDACHLGVKADDKGTIVLAKVVLPTPNLKMNHKAHAAKGVLCVQCHGEVGELELATRDQLPRMKGCLGCHQGGDASKGAKSDCKTCHLTEKDGTLKQMFASGVLLPPKWLKNSAHASDWIERHKKVAGADSGFCANCHTESYCVACHDGKTKPKSVHPNDWLATHEIAARFDQPKCASCHSQQNFCLPCHTRVGIAQSSPAGVAAPVRFHPDPTVWSAPKRVPGHHSYEAQKNINACVSCHVERDCVVCHGTQGVGGAGANPHGASFVSKCDTMFAKNPRPCFVCHDPDDPKLKPCR